MEIKYLSSSEAALFSEMIHEGGELAELFATFMVQLDVDTDFESVMVSFEDPYILRVVIEDSPYIVVLDEPEQSIFLYAVSEFEDDDDDLCDEYDLDEDGIETVIDVMVSRVLSTDYDA